jgi:predicted nucleic acid-binding protein
MIAVDTSSLIAFFQGDNGDDVARVTTALASGQIVLPPVVLTEILSRPPADPAAVDLVDAIGLLAVLPGYWERAAQLRRRVLLNGLKSNLGDALIAQSCIDHTVPLITRDADFRHYAAHGLALG